MAFDENLAARIRDALARKKNIEEKNLSARCRRPPVPFGHSSAIGIMLK